MHYTLCDMIADLAQNAVEANSSLVTVEVTMFPYGETRSAASQTAFTGGAGETLGFTITDNGCGMDEVTLEKAKDPFYTDGIKHPRRSVGLGIPFLIQTAEETGGQWGITSRKGGPEGSGTRVWGNFPLDNIDTPPVGSIPGLFRSILTFPESPEVCIHRTGPNVTYTVTRSEMVDALGDLERVDSLALLDQYLEGLEENE
jgi:hypothetical protein